MNAATTQATFQHAAAVGGRPGKPSLLGSPGVRIWLVLMIVMFGMGALVVFTNIAGAVATLDQDRLPWLFSTIGSLLAIFAFSVGRAASNPLPDFGEWSDGPAPGLDPRRDFGDQGYAAVIQQPTSNDDYSQFFEPEETVTYDPLNPGGEPLRVAEDDDDDFEPISPDEFEGFEAPPEELAATAAEAEAATTVEPAPAVVQAVAPPAPKETVEAVATEEAWEAREAAAPEVPAPPVQSAAVEAAETEPADVQAAEPEASGARAWLKRLDDFLTRPVSVRTVIVTIAGSSTVCAYATWHWLGSAGQALTTLIAVAIASAVFSRALHMASRNRRVVDDLRTTNNRLIQEIVKRRVVDAAAEAEAPGTPWKKDLEFESARIQDLEALRTKFLNEVSHELRGPITAINLAARIIMKHHVYDHDVVERFGSTIVNEGDRLSQIVNEFLELAKIESGCVKWNDSHVTSEEVVAAAVFSAESQAKERGVVLDSHVDDDLPPLTVDRDRIVQAVATLITAAVGNAAEEEHITIHATRGADESLFAIEQSKAASSKKGAIGLFGTQEKIERTEKNEGAAGNGLAMCIVSEIVSHYGGHVWSEGRSGESSAFVISIPDEPVGVAPADPDDGGAGDQGRDASSDEKVDAYQEYAIAAAEPEAAPEPASDEPVVDVYSDAAGLEVADEDSASDEPVEAAAPEAADSLGTIADNAVDGNDPESGDDDDEEAEEEHYDWAASEASQADEAVQASEAPESDDAYSAFLRGDTEAPSAPVNDFAFGDESTPAADNTLDVMASDPDVLHAIAGAEPAEPPVDSLSGGTPQAQPGTHYSNDHGKKAAGWHPTQRASQAAFVRKTPPKR